MSVSQLQPQQLAVLEGQFGTTSLPVVGSPALQVNAADDGSGNAVLTISITFTPAMMNTSANPVDLPPNGFFSVYNLGVNVFSSGSVGVLTALSGDLTIATLTSVNLITTSLKGRLGI